MRPQNNRCPTRQPSAGRPSFLMTAVAESFAIEADDRIDLATRWIVARDESV